MGNLRILPEGQDFDHTMYDKNFGFSGSAQGYDNKGSANPPFAASKPTDNGMNFQNYAEGGAVGGSAHTYAEGGKVKGHPMGHHVTHVTHDPATNAVMMHHAHGGFTMHHPDGGISHHGADGQPAMATGGGGDHPGEGTFLERARGGRAHMPPPHKKPMQQAMPKERATEPDDTAPRNPMRNPSRRNAMPGGQMPYGVEPSAEPDVAGSGQGIDDMPSSDSPAMARGGNVRHR